MLRAIVGLEPRVLFFQFPMQLHGIPPAVGLGEDGFQPHAVDAVIGWKAT